MLLITQSLLNRAEFVSHYSMPFVRQPERFSGETIDKANTLVIKLESFYKNFASEGRERRQRYPCTLSAPSLFPREDDLNAKLKKEKANERKCKDELKAFTERETGYLRKTRTKVSVKDFQHKVTIGKGGFGIVCLVQKKDTGAVYAMKAMKKSKASRAQSERELLVNSGKSSPWVVKLFFTFQDSERLYFVLDFLPGGDFLGLLITKGKLSEDEAQFYIAELLAAVDSIHKLDIIHRYVSLVYSRGLISAISDIKPDNIMIDADGHLKLTDFGLSTSKEKHQNINERFRNFQVSGLQPAKAVDVTFTPEQEATWRKGRRLQANSHVGTYEYMAPEVIRSQSYGKECDVWSVGVILYECLVGRTPFFSLNQNRVEHRREVANMVHSWQYYLKIPAHLQMSINAQRAIRDMVCEAKDRHTVAELKSHPFFENIDWKTLQDSPSKYFVPELDSRLDVKYFNLDDLNLDQNVFDDFLQNSGTESSENSDLPFIGFTYRNMETLRL